MPSGRNFNQIPAVYRRIVKASYGRLFRLNFQDLYAPFVVTATWRKNIFESRHF